MCPTLYRGHRSPVDVAKILKKEKVRKKVRKTEKKLRKILEKSKQIEQKEGRGKSRGTREKGGTLNAPGSYGKGLSGAEIAQNSRDARGFCQGRGICTCVFFGFLACRHVEATGVLTLNAPGLYGKGLSAAEVEQNSRDARGFCRGRGICTCVFFRDCVAGCLFARNPNGRR